MTTGRINQVLLYKHLVYQLTHRFLLLLLRHLKNDKFSEKSPSLLLVKDSTYWWLYGLQMWFILLTLAAFAPRPALPTSVTKPLLWGPHPHVASRNPSSKEYPQAPTKVTFPYTARLLISTSYHIIL